MTAAPPSSPSWLGRSPAFWHTVACVTLAVLTAATFVNALNDQFVSYDDWFLVEENTRIRSLSLDSLSTMLLYRSPQGAWQPFREFSYALDYACWGLDPFGYHLSNLALHTANVLLVYALAVWLLRRQPLAWLAAAAFAVHPVQVEAVTWVAGRRDVLYAFFFLLSFLAFVRSERRYREGRPWSWAYAASLACLLVALLSKPSAMMLPALLVLAVVLVEEGRDPLWQRLLVIAPHGTIAAAIAGIQYWSASEAKVVKSRVIGEQLASMPWTFAMYWKLLFLPVHLATPHSRVPLTWDSDAKVILLSLAVWVGVTLVLWKAAPRRTIALFCLGWWYVMLLPVSNLVPLSMLVAERYMYMPIVGLCILGADIAGSLWRRRRRALIALCVGAILALLAVQTHVRNRIWYDGKSFWRDGITKWPDSPVTRIGLAASHLDTNEPMLAWKQYQKIIDPRGMAHSKNSEHTSLVNAGLTECYDRVARHYEREGQVDKALEVYETVVRQMPQRIEPRIDLAQAYQRHGRRGKAVEQLEAIRKLRGGYDGLPKALLEILSGTDADTDR